VLQHLEGVSNLGCVVTMHRGLDNLYAPVTQLQELTAARTLSVQTVTMRLEQPLKAVQKRSVEKL